VRHHALNLLGQGWPTFVEHLRVVAFDEDILPLGERINNTFTAARKLLSERLWCTMSIKYF
jgi:hypothetical protein